MEITAQTFRDICNFSKEEVIDYNVKEAVDVLLKNILKSILNGDIKNSKSATINIFCNYLYEEDYIIYENKIRARFESLGFKVISISEDKVMSGYIEITIDWN